MPGRQAPVLLGGLGVLVLRLAVEVHARRLYHELGRAVVGLSRRASGSVPLRFPLHRACGLLRVRLSHLRRDTVAACALRPCSSVAPFALSPRAPLGLVGQVRGPPGSRHCPALLLLSLPHIASSLTLTLIVGLAGVVCPLCLLLLVIVGLLTAIEQWFEFVFVFCLFLLWFLHLEL